MGGLLRAVCDPRRVTAVGPIIGWLAIGPCPSRVVEGSARHRAPPTSRWEGGPTVLSTAGGGSLVVLNGVCCGPLC